VKGALGRKDGQGRRGKRSYCSTRKGKDSKKRFCPPGKPDFREGKKLATAGGGKKEVLQIYYRRKDDC